MNECEETTTCEVCGVLDGSEHATAHAQRTGHNVTTVARDGLDFAVVATHPEDYQLPALHLKFGTLAKALKRRRNLSGIFAFVNDKLAIRRLRRARTRSNARAP